MSKLNCLQQVSEFPLLSAILGRRSRRFSMGASIESGPFAFKSKKQVEPLSEFERTIIVTTMAGNTGWSHLIPFNQKYSPSFPNYAGSAGGRTFPSAAGFHTTNLFFTDDSGVFYLGTRDNPACAKKVMSADLDVEDWIGETNKCIKKLSDERLQMPQEEPFIESHNLWVANCPGSLMAVPVADLAQHMILMLCYLVQNGYGVFDDLNKEQIPGLEKFGHFIDLKNPMPLSYIEQIGLGEVTVEVSTSCYAGALLLQSMGLGGWMYDGIDRHAIFGVTGDARNKGLGFSSIKKDDWVFANPVGLPGVFEAFCPPNFSNMRAAVAAAVQRKFGEHGPFHIATEGPWKETKNIRGVCKIHSDEFIECVSVMCDYIYGKFGKFPATVPSIYCLTVLQAMHLDTEFYDHFYKQGSYLQTHAEHLKRWH